MERVGFELAVRLAKFAFEIPKEFPAQFAKLGFRENFAPEVLVARVHLGLQGPVVLPVVCPSARIKEPRLGRALPLPKERPDSLLA